MGPLPPLCIHSIPGSFSQLLLSLQAQKFLTDALLMELLMAIIFTLKFFPRAPCECAGSSRNLNTAFLCSQASLPWCPRHSDSMPWHCPWQNGLSQQLRNAVREDSTCLGRTSTEHFWQKILERKTNSHNFHASNRFPDQIFPWHTLLVIVLTHTFSCMHEMP